MEAGPSRKRLRRSTRSCYQCRKRKVKCQLIDEKVDTCAECVKSGTQCAIQPPETELSSEGSPIYVDKEGQEARLERIESLLKRLVEAQEQSRPAEASLECESIAPVSIWNDFLLQSTADGTLPPVDDNILPIHQSENTSDEKQPLVALLPSAQDAVTIVTNSTAWLWGAETPLGSVLRPNDTLQLLDVAAISSGSTIHIAKILLLFALYMQQLPSHFDVQFIGSESIEKTIELIVDRVRLFVLSHEDEASSLDGIECLTLLSSIYLNDGAIRKAWMIFRRVLDIARLKGFQNSFSLSARSSPRSDIALQRRLWLSTVCGDCYCSLLLGLEPGLGIAPFGPDDDTWMDPLADEDANVQRRICLIVSRIAQRNAVGFGRDRSILREIDEALNRLQDSMPASWWRAPSFRQDRSLDSAKEPNRLICQLWFYQARVFAHLPIAFGKATNDSLDSLESCIEASRFTIHRYLGLQHVKDQLSRCRAVEQSAFLAAVILLLAKLQLQYHEKCSTASRYDSDRALLDQVISSFEASGEVGSREHVARQSYEILSTMLDIISSSEDTLFVTSTSAPNTPSTLGSSFDPDMVGNTKDTSSATKSRMEDIIASSIQPALGVESPASQLIKLLFTKSSMAKPPQQPSHITLAIDGLIDPTILQRDTS
ncbi:hypothetical protein F5Y00DRAFT_161731 [Daldinia vernicosa]|uniref:uncharacterized protein n=1 Tax=Daldinia vernicosa TaxID=114800 RepID=UPI0020088F4D|nr:uncharacterized protein F5Y00DRAFT_161731 [Daldinia vernicosa]KAI0845876.1 hypothetical protein F5Y00DRAFT_161731 [Daldinia vernicosa]